MESGILQGRLIKSVMGWTPWQMNSNDKLSSQTGLPRMVSEIINIIYIAPKLCKTINLLLILC